MSVWLSRRLVLLLLGRIKVGSLIVVEGDERLVFGSGSPTATLQIASARTWRMLLRGSRGMAEAFAQGLWNSPDLVALIRLAARNAGGLDTLRSRSAPVRWPLQRAGALLRRSTKRRRRRDVAAHYDLGNELFARMLDPTMSYSCAVFEHEGMTLEQAQVAKLERICEQLDLGPGDRVLEIGTGWGAFALHAAATRGCHVTTTTISREQHDYAVEQVRRAGLTDRVMVLKENYRALRGRYDKLVSIRENAPARIINVSSGGMYTQKLRVDDLQSEHGKFDGPKVYARTKRAEVILTEIWAEQLAGTGVVVHAMHPGWADTPSLRSSLPRFYKVTRPLLRTPAQGADTIVWLGAAAEPGRSSGRFWHDRRPRPTHWLQCTRGTRQQREQLLAECARLSGWHDASVPTASTSIPEGES